MANSVVEGMMRELCHASHNFRLLFLLAVAWLGMAAVWLPFITPVTSTFVIVWMNIAAAAGFALFSGSFVVVCRRRNRKRREAEDEEYRRQTE